MVKTASTMLPLGVVAPDFSLPDAQGKQVSLADFADAPALLVVFMCNHCPYVKHVAAGLAQLAAEYQRRGVAVVGINSNDTAAFPDDVPAKMAEEVKVRGYTFPYLFDEKQTVAQAYRAACTPDFYVFDRQRKLVYRGQMDSSRPGNDVPVTGEDLRAGARCRAWPTGRRSAKQKPSLGCNIKWGRATSRIISADRGCRPAGAERSRSPGRYDAFSRFTSRRLGAST